MDEEYGYGSLKADHEKLKEAITDFMTKSDLKERATDTSRFVLVRPGGVRWNEEKLKRLLSPTLFSSITNRVVDPHKIDIAVKAGKIERSVIAPALEEYANKPYLRKFGVTDKEERATRNESEADALEIAQARSKRKGRK